MYLSRLRLNPLHAAARRDLADAYEMHRSLARVYAPDDVSPPGRFLWRLESARLTASPTLLVQAALPGRWEVLAANHGYAARIEADKLVDSTRLVQDGRAYRFKLLANATVTRGGKRYGLHGEEPLLGWIERQGRRHGFALVDVAIRSHPRMWASRNGGDKRVVLDPTLFEGYLRTVDAVALRSALLSGVGHGKAFGLGMLSVAPMPATAAPR